MKKISKVDAISGTDKVTYINNHLIPSLEYIYNTAVVEGSDIPAKIIKQAIKDICIYAEDNTAPDILRSASRLPINSDTYRMHQVLNILTKIKNKNHFANLIEILEDTIPQETEAHSEVTPHVTVTGNGSGINAI